MPLILTFFNTRDLLYYSYGLGLRRPPNQTDCDVTFSRSRDQWKITKKWSKDNYERLINLLTQISKLSYFNLFDLADFWCITVSLFIFWCGNRGCALIQPHTCACNMYIVLSMVINWQSRRFDHNDSHMPESVLYPSSCTCNSHIIKNKSFLAYFMRILNSCVVQQVSNCQAWCPPSQPHTFSAPLLFDETLAQLDGLAVVNSSSVTLSVFYSEV